MVTAETITTPYQEGVLGLRYRAVARSDFRHVGAPVPNPGVTMRRELA